MEALLENLTNLPMRLDSVRLDPSPFFDVTPMNTITNPDGSQALVFGPVNRFNASEFRQYLFCLSPKQEIRDDVKLLKTVTVIGKLDIKWTSGVGCRGHLQTSQLERMGPAYSDVRLTISRAPSTVDCRSKFPIVARVSNCSDREIELSISFDNLAADQAILWLGISGRSLGVLQSGESTDVHLTCYPIRPGLWPVPAIRLTDSGSKRDFNFEEAAYVYVHDPATSHPHSNTSVHACSSQEELLQAQQQQQLPQQQG